MTLEHNISHQSAPNSNARAVLGSKSAASLFAGGFALLGLVSLLLVNPYPMPFAGPLFVAPLSVESSGGITEYAPLIYFIEGSILLVYLAALTWHDVRSLRLPNGLTYSLFLLGAVRAATNGWLEVPYLTEGLLVACVTAAVGCGVLLGLRQYYLSQRGIDALGLGDVKLLAGMGVWLGPLYLAPAVALAAITGLIYGLARQISQRTKKQTAQKPDSPQPIAFGPFLCFGFWMMWLLGHGSPLFLPSV